MGIAQHVSTLLITAQAAKVVIIGLDGFAIILAPRSISLIQMPQIALNVQSFAVHAA
jgi:hypothetical protein